MNNYDKNKCFTIYKLIGFMSVDVARDYHSDLSQLKFLTCIPHSRSKLCWDLNHNINGAVKRTTDDNNEKITLLLRYILDNSKHLNILYLKRLPPLIVTYRRTLISVMCNANNYFAPFSIIATLFKGCIYLCSIETQQERVRRYSRSPQEEKFCAWGYKFEQYVLSDSPALAPDIQRPVIENEEFSLIYYSKLGDHELLYGAQIDGLYAVGKNVPEPPKTIDTEINLKYLQSNAFIELKTNREIYSRRQEQNFKRRKLLRCWCQCYLAGLKGLLVGFRNDEGVVQRLQWYDTEDLTAYCKTEWNPQTALTYLDNFLSYVQSSFRHHFEKSLGENYMYNTKPVSLQFELDSNNEIKINSEQEQLEPILPEWYIKSEMNESVNNI